MNFDYLFVPTEKWTNSIHTGEFIRKYTFTPLLLNCVNLLLMIRFYLRFHGPSAEDAIGLGFMLVCIIGLLGVAAYTMARLYRVMRQRLTSGSLDAASHQALLSAGFLGYRLYLTLLVICFATLSCMYGLRT